jgi:hypothetical protein
MVAGNDEALAQAGIAVPEADAAQAAAVGPLATPELTTAQIVGGIPVVAGLLHSFGVYTLTASQESSLSKAVTYAVGLIGADALIRLGRSVGSRF